MKLKPEKIEEIIKDLKASRKRYVTIANKYNISMEELYEIIERYCPDLKRHTEATSKNKVVSTREKIDLTEIKKWFKENDRLPRREIKGVKKAEKGYKETAIQKEVRIGSMFYYAYYTIVKGYEGIEAEDIADEKDREIVKVIRPILELYRERSKEENEQELLESMTELEQYVEENKRRPRRTIPQKELKRRNVVLPSDIESVIRSVESQLSSNENDVERELRLGRKWYAIKIWLTRKYNDIGEISDPVEREIAQRFFVLEEKANKFAEEYKTSETKFKMLDESILSNMPMSISNKNENTEVEKIMKRKLRARYLYLKICEKYGQDIDMDNDGIYYTILPTHICEVFKRAGINAKLIEVFDNGKTRPCIIFSVGEKDILGDVKEHLADPILDYKRIKIGCSTKYFANIPKNKEDVERYTRIGKNHNIFSIPREELCSIDKKLGYYKEKYTEDIISDIISEVTLMDNEYRKSKDGSLQASDIGQPTDYEKMLLKVERVLDRLDSEVFSKNRNLQQSDKQHLYEMLLNKIFAKEVKCGKISFENSKLIIRYSKNKTEYIYDKEKGAYWFDREEVELERD